MQYAEPGYVVRHAIPGRLRIRLTGLTFPSVQIARLARRLAQQAGVGKADAHAGSRCIILIYDTRTTSADAVLALFTREFSAVYQ